MGLTGVLMLGLLGVPCQMHSGIEWPGLSWDTEMVGSLFHVVSGPHVSLWPLHAASPEGYTCSMAAQGSQRRPRGTHQAFPMPGLRMPGTSQFVPSIYSQVTGQQKYVWQGTKQGHAGQQAWLIGASFGDYPPRSHFTYKKTDTLRVK